MTKVALKKADIVDVARVAKVSISTVSRSFNHPDLVKPATRKRIDRAVRKLGYIRNRAAQAMHGIRNGTIGLVVPTLDHAIFAEVVQSFSESVEAEGFTILLATHGYDLEREYAVMRKFLEHRVDGVAVIGLDHSEELYQLIESQNVPAISVWNFDPASVLPCIGSDNYKAGQHAAQHIVDLGHRDVAILFPPVADNDRARGRLQGTLDILAGAGTTPRAAWQLEASYQTSDAKAVATGLFNAQTRPTALICGNDVLAIGALFAATQAGLRVPEDLSIVGIGDFTGSRDFEPALSTVQIPARSIGRQAGQAIVQAIKDPGTPVAHVECDVRLMARQTSRAI